MNLQCGDMILCKNKGLLSRIVKWFTDSEYSHVALVLDEKHLYHTNYNTNLKITHMIYPRNSYDVYRVIGEYDKDKLQEFIYNNINNKYDFMDIVKIIFRINTDDKDNEYICSELVRRAYEYAGLKLVDDTIKIATPQDIANSKFIHKL